jgi:outer membrane protein OmpA-like peptidoglycan-associated protein
MPNYSHAIEEIIPDGKEHKKDYTIFNKVNLQLNVFDSDMFEALSSTIIVKADGVKSSVKPTEFAKGRYKMELPIGKKYQFTIKKELYLDTTFNLDLSQIVIFDSFERDVELNSDKNRVKFQVNGLEPGLTTEITIIDISTSSKFTTSITTDQNGKCDIMLRKGDTYKVNILTKGYTMFEKTIDIPKVAKDEDILVIANIAKLEENVRVEIPNVNFETNSYTLDPASYEDLDRAVSLLKLNRDINVELSAHTDDKGSDAYNDKLSEQRAASVAAYIINKGVDKKRIVSKGYGKKQPLVPNTSDENRAKNRRVELKILSTVSE